MANIIVEQDIPKYNNTIKQKVLWNSDGLSSKIFEYKRIVRNDGVWRITNVEYKPTNSKISGVLHNSESNHTSYSSGNLLNIFVIHCIDWSLNDFQFSFAVFCDEFCIRFRWKTFFLNKLRYVSSFSVANGEIVERP